MGRSVRYLADVLASHSCGLGYGAMRTRREKRYKLLVFGFEMGFGVLFGFIGLGLMFYESKIFGSLTDKIALSTLTVGGTALMAGLFRYAFWGRFGETEDRIENIDEVVKSVEVKLASALESWEPMGFERLDKHYADYRHLYWRTKHGIKEQWVSSEELRWQRQLVPFFLETRASILEQPFHLHRSVYVMVELKKCLVIAATRVRAAGGADTEMAGVYIFSLPPVPGAEQLFGYQHHENMNGKLSLSGCILSKSAIPKDDLETEWLKGYESSHLDKNYQTPRDGLPQVGAPKTAA